MKTGLATRMTLLILVAQTLLLTLLATLTYQAARNAMMRSLDEALQARARAIALLVEEDEEGFETEITESDLRVEGIFTITTEDGQLIESSRDFNPPFMNIPRSENAFVAITHDIDGAPYRATIFDTTARSEINSSNRPIRVFYSIPLSDTNQQLRTLRAVVFAICGIIVLLSAFVSILVAGFGLRPIKRLAYEVSQIHEERLNNRIEEDRLPRDLAPIAASVNGLMDRIESAFERERRFSSDAAHEIRTPLATLKSGVQAALLNPPNDYKETLEHLLLDIQRLESLCDALLLVTKREGRQSPSISFDSWIEEINAAVHSLIDGDQRGIQISAPSESTQSLVQADTVATSRIVTNLVGNAIRYAGEGAIIRIDIILNDENAEFTVEDNGPGIPDEAVPHLFERFYRVDTSRARVAGGYGLGLAICRTLARAHGGDVIYTKNEPSGCRFTWRTPLWNPSRESS